MVRESVNLLELLRRQAAGGDLDFLREAVAVLAEAVMEAEVAEQAGAAYGERSPERITRRNGYRPRRWDTRAGSIELQIPKLRQGSYFPALLEPRRRAERALRALAQQAYVEGISTRRVDDLVRSLGCEGISKSQVSRICAELDTVVAGRRCALAGGVSRSRRSMCYRVSESTVNRRAAMPSGSDMFIALPPPPAPGSQSRLPTSGVAAGRPSVNNSPKA